MMSLIAVCGCGERKKVPESAAGKSFACPACGDRVLVPQSGEAKTKAAATEVTPALPPRVSGKRKKSRQPSEPQEPSRPRRVRKGSRVQEFLVAVLLATWPYLIGVASVVGLVVAIAGWQRSREDQQALIERMLSLAADLDGSRFGADPTIRSKIFVVERPYGSAYLETGGYGPPVVSSIQSQLPAELQATTSDSQVTYVVVTKSMDFQSNTYVKPGEKPVTGGVEKRADVVLLDYSDGQFRILGKKQFSTATPDSVTYKQQLSMAPSPDPLVRDWLLSLPRE